MQQILAPPQVLSVLGTTTTAAVLSSAEPVTVALRYVEKYDYSQFPVYEGDRYVGLLTTNAIARWLAHQLSSNVGLAETEAVSKVMQFAEPHEHGKVVARSITASSAIAHLSGDGAGRPPALAPIVTHDGKRDQQPLAVVVGDVSNHLLQ